MKLLSITDFVLDIEQKTPKATNFSSFTTIANYEKLSYDNILNYVNFLKEPLEIWMFTDYEKKYFKNIDIREACLILMRNENIEDLVYMNLELTETAIKKIGL